MSKPAEILADDINPAVDFPVNDSDGLDLDWTPLLTAVGDEDYADNGAEWLNEPAASRWIRVPVAGLDPGTGVGGKTYTVYLQVPDGTDIELGQVKVRNRS